MKVLRFFYPLEIFLIFMIPLTAALYCFVEVPIRDLRKQYLSEMIWGLDVYVMAICLIFVALLIRGVWSRSRQDRLTASNFVKELALNWQEINSKYLRVEIVLRDLRGFNALILTLILFAELKHIIPAVNPRIFDAYIYHWELSWFGGELVGVRLQRILGVGAASLMSMIYTLFYPYVTLLVCVMVLQRRDRTLTDRFSLSFALTWVFGVFWIYAIPTWGPCFFKPELFSSLPSTKVSEIQSTLWELKRALDNWPKHPNGLFAISGFPSLHIAIAAMGTFYLRKISAVLGWISGGFLIVTFLSTLYFGWHYLLDDIGALPLAVCSIFIGESVLRKRVAGTSESQPVRG